MTSTPIVPGRYIARQFQGEASVAGNITANGQSVELNVQGCNAATFFVNGTWTGTLQYEHWTQAGWVAIGASLLSSPGSTQLSTTTTINSVRTLTVTGIERIRIVAAAAITGTANIVIRASQGPTNALLTAVYGSSARASATLPNPILTGFRGATAAPSAVTNAQLVDALATVQGIQITRPWQIPELTWTYSAGSGGITATGDNALANAAGAGLRRYITNLTLSNNSATATEVQLKDGASTVLQRWWLPGNAPNFYISFEVPPLTTANTALNIAITAAGAAVYANATGFTAP